MPDEKQASNEHALLQEISEPLGRIREDAGAEAAAVDFPVVLRGYDRIAVDAYVRRTTDLIAELQATRSPEAAVRRALERVGDEVSGILQRAHETAAQITGNSRAEAEDRLEQARAEAREITAAADRRVKELDTETDRIWAERQRIVEDAQQLAHQLLGLAESAAERFPAEESAGESGESGESGGAAAAGEGPGAGAPGAPAPSDFAEDDEPTVAIPYPGDVTSPTVAFPVPFGAGVGEAAGEEVGGPAGEDGEARRAPEPGVGAVPAEEPIGEPSPESSDPGEPPAHG